AHEQMLHCGDVTVDVAARVVIIDGTEVDGFTRRQFDLLVAFMRNEGRLLTYATLIGVVWGVEVDGDHHWPSLRTAISRVRRTLGDGADRPIVLTEKHVGYRLVLPGQG
ncbi:MAG: response regulator, partial [Ilumatobacteraceae bacterium]|nr:response regulator [Ilumatobacteraceae bacterium]